MNIINFLLSLVTTATAVISVIVSVKTLKQNNKMIEESTRPVITVYANSCNTGTQHFFIIFKNFGSTPAVIDDVTCDIEFTFDEVHDPRFDDLDNFFARLNGATVAPGQSIRCPVNASKLKEHHKTKINFDISYHSDVHKYKNKYTIDWLACIPFVDEKTSENSKNKSLNHISYALQEMVQNDL